MCFLFPNNRNTTDDTFGMLLLCWFSVCTVGYELREDRPYEY